MVDIRQSQRYAKYLSRMGWKVERIGEINCFIKKFSLIGSVLKVQRPEEVRIDIIRKLAKKHRAFQIIVEPKTETDAEFLVSIGFKLSKNPYLPTKTLRIGLTQPKEKIFKSFKKDTRASIKRGGAIEIKEYSTPDEITKWREAWKNSVKFNRYVPSADQLINLRKSFPSNHSTFLASHNISGRIIGGALFTRSSHDFAYYWQAFTNKEGRTSLSQYPLLYQGILWAKRQGCKFFDFEGIYDSRFPNKDWLGFTHFKKAFGGYEISYPGCYIKNIIPGNWNRPY
ncbi:MAG: FemAB domain protein [Candidatus Woesebacteria bacterium GW2011_GWB1_45_5]|uniref:FemAB domain protein n=1 Tax=Candidatus Woesebacteria bacterium GW2011_GWB1_45_5 TaxID=1618581 RepID=A0A0G1QNC0_9BACT|nr:MAG: FemAB domain protein [Candidatus Woesebacteria bacterium GW2011_GWB1_45_5]